MSYVFHKNDNGTPKFWLAPFHTESGNEEWIEDPMDATNFTDELFYRGGWTDLIPASAETIKVILSEDLPVQDFWSIYRDENGGVLRVGE